MTEVCAVAENGLEGGEEGKGISERLLWLNRRPRRASASLNNNSPDPLTAAVCAMSRGPGVLSLHEVGTARLIFNSDFSSFEGVLINAHDETFGVRGSLHGRLLDPVQSDPSPSTSSDPNHNPFTSAPTPQLQVPMEGTEWAAEHFEVTIVDGDSGNQYCLKRVGYELRDAGQVVLLKSDNLTFATEEVLVRNRADIELRTYINPELVGKGHSVHLGGMTINVQAAITPPPTPSSIIDSEHSAVEDMEQDFLK